MRQEEAREFWIVCLPTSSSSKVGLIVNIMKEETFRRLTEAISEINNKKTKEMRINLRNNSDLILDGRVIESVEEFCYLGSMVSQDGGCLLYTSTYFSSKFLVFQCFVCVTVQMEGQGSEGRKGH